MPSTKSHLWPNDMAFDVVPAKAEVVAVVWIYPKPQQLAFDTWASETALRALVVSIGKIPENIVIVPIYKISHHRTIR